MRFKMIGCEVLARQLYYVAAFSPYVIDIELLGKGLHTEPDKLRNGLQAALDNVQEGMYAAVLLGYGLCSNSVAGVVCRHTKMVIPRAHDCITLYLGSGERYASEFRANPGTYWYTADYFERDVDGTDVVALGVVGDDQNMSKVYEEYVQKYGKDNADYLMEVMGAWKQHYSRAAYIDTQEVRLPDYSAQVQEVAARRGWNFERLAGSLIILRDLLEGRWDEERFLIIPPGETIAPTYDGHIVAACQPS
jgi:hypothetical protein